MSDRPAPRPERDLQRDLHPIPEAVFAMYHWGRRYVTCGLGSMSFFNHELTMGERKYCIDAIKQIVLAQDEHGTRRKAER